MQIYHLNDLANKNFSHPTPFPPNVMTIGNFDGVHLGHQAMIEQVKTLSQSQSLASAVMVFEPQPREFFAPQTAPARLTNFAEKAELIEALGVDILIVANFDDLFRNLSALEFAEVLQKLNVKSLVLGDDFRFGHDRTGDSDFLQKFGFMVQTLDTITDTITDITPSHERVSSTRVREALLAGDLATAEQLLGRKYAITGVVQHGDKIGRTLDFPTANIALDRIKPALHGIFGASVSLADGENLADLSKDEKKGVQGLSKGSLFGACNVGTRPAIQKNGEQGVEWRCEVFFPEFEGDLYGKNLTMTFLHFLHGERDYASLEDLKTGIHQDVVNLLVWRNEFLA